jgi:DNA-binding CsgD family transcriptional regulator/PAS domain-containing protein
VDTTLERFSAAVAAIHEAAAAPQRWPAALEAVMALLEVKKGALIDVRADPLQLESIHGIGHDDATQKAYAEHYFAIDPTREAGLAMAPGDVFQCYAVFDERARARHEYFDFARRADIGDVVGLSTPVVAGRRHILSVQRSADAPAFEAETKRLLGMIGPHLHRAREVQARLHTAELAQVELEAGLDAVTAPAFIINARGWIQHLNAAAAQFVRENPGAIRLSGVLGFVEPGVESRYRQAMKEAAREGGQCQIIRLDLGHPDKTELVIAPLQPRPGVAWTEPLVLVVVAQASVDAEGIAWRLRELYGLSATEARVAAAIALGHTVEQIAGANGVKEVTLRTQLRSVFQKTGTTRQVELVRLALAAGAFRIRR